MATLAICALGYTFIGYAADNSDDLPLYAKPSFGYVLVSSSYHYSMNDFFNEKINRLVEMLNQEKFYKNPDFNPPSENQVCTDNNVSTYCVSKQALEMYIVYLESLEEIKAQLPVRSDADAFPQYLSDVYNTILNRNNNISEEVISSKKVLEATIATYDEFRLAYPMHQEYEQIINSLLKYKLALKEVRKRVSKFPGKFIDASSAYCD